VDSLDILLQGTLWSDAAYVAERVLTADELKSYVDHAPQTASEKREGDDDRTKKLRYLLGRRLVREDRYPEAAAYLPEEYQKVLDVYGKALKDGASAKTPKEERARALSTAAWIARVDGMEIMGTEGAPDGFSSEGAFEEVDVAKERQTGTYLKTSYQDTNSEPKRLPVALPVSAKEKQRLLKSSIKPDVRFHYRVIAAALALRAAELMPDGSNELADLLNVAGRWAMDRDKKLAERCYTMIERRCPNTEIGRAVLGRHWFVEASGPWGKAQHAAHDAMFPPKKNDSGSDADADPESGTSEQ
jgi:hypothetical protein